MVKMCLREVQLVALPDVCGAASTSQQRMVNEMKPESQEMRVVGNLCLLGADLQEGISKWRLALVFVLHW